MKYIILFFFIICTDLSFGQLSDKEKSELYKNYREDQFYISISYNLLLNRPENVSQNGFSSGFHLGFIRDMPINKDRDLALGLGLGLSSNSYNQNIAIVETSDAISYNIIDDNEINVSKNKFTTYLLELPFEFRWRTSTAKDYNFWRIYPGFKLGYVVYNSTKFKSDQDDEQLSNLEDFERLQYGLTLSIGYGTWNFHAYYGLNPIFKNEAKLNENTIDMRSLKLGLMFYIL